MMEWFSNIGTWFVDNKDAIILFFTSGQFISFITVIFVLIKNVKAVKNNTNSSDTLNQNIIKNEQLNANTDACRQNTECLIESTEDTKQQLLAVADKLENELIGLTDKLNTLLEVLTIVYSTIKDEKVRNTVNSLLVNAKYAENSTRAELQRQVIELKSIIKTQLEQLNKDVEERVEKVTSTVGGENNLPERY